MQNFYGLVANIAAIVGTLICLVAGLMRIGGNPYVAGFESITLFTGGMAVMLFAVLLKLQAIHLDMKK